MKIARMQTKAFWKGEFGIEGLVEDKGCSYQVRLEVKNQNVNSYFCSCDRGNSYKQMCSHGKALYEHYLKKAQEKDEESVSTSSQARVMIREYTNREMAAILRREIEETVELKPRLLLGKQGVRVEFWIGKERLYIIKDLLSFSKAVGQGA